MSKIEILNPQTHEELKLDINVGTEFDDVRPMVDVVAEELPQLVLDCPVFITKHPETGQFELKAILGFSEKENLFIQDGKWVGSYIPMDIRRLPFQACFVSKEEGAEFDFDDVTSSDHLKLGLNVESNRLSTEQGEPLFDKEGEPSEYVKTVSGILSNMLSGMQKTRAFLAELAKHDLISPTKLDVTFGEQKMSFDGLYSIVPEKLSKLESGVLVDFHRKGYLQVCHAIIHSQGHIGKLIQWKSDKEQA